MTYGLTHVPALDLIVRDLKSPLLSWMIRRRAKEIRLSHDALRDYASSAGEQEGRFALYFQKPLADADRSLTKNASIAKVALFVVLACVYFLGWTEYDVLQTAAATILLVVLFAQAYVACDIFEHWDPVRIAAVRAGRIDVFSHGDVGSFLLRNPGEAREFAGFVRVSCGQFRDFGSPHLIDDELRLAEGSFKDVVLDEMRRVEPAH